MAATIQTIEKPTRARALDTSGNNNHGQIYSGRALEFDGVADYFQHNGGTALSGVNQFANGESWTFATWINFNTTKFCIFVGNDNSSKPFIGLHNSDWIQFRTASAGKYYRFDSNQNNALAGAEPLQAGTWYRLVITAQSDVLTCYLNGVQHGSTVTTSTNDTTNSVAFEGSAIEFSGWGGPYGSPRAHILDGMMSDGQVWNASWTAADALYDYNNPEQLALNRGGTSLTNSNLKIWYPMNDGHRGQQSYVLDASNLGIGNELIDSQSDRDFSGSNNWALVNGSGSATMSTTGGQLVFSGSTTSDYPYLHRDYVTDFKAGDSIRYELVLSDVSGGTVKVQLDGGANIATGLTSGTNIFYHNGTSGNALKGETRIIPESSSMSFKIDSLSLKPINDKNHATTVFYGDELITNGSFEADSNWADYNSVSANVRSSTQAHSGTYSRKFTVDDANQGIQGDTFTTVTGRTYLLSFEIYPDDATTARIAIRKGDNSDWADDTAFSGLTQDAWNTKTVTYTETAGGSGAFLVIHGHGNTSGDFYVDDVSIKEVGVATGWTDADQQLDIPQTALQSYNQLAWFDGYASDTAATLDSQILWEVGQTINMWVYPNVLNQYDSIFGDRNTRDYIRTGRASGTYSTNDEIFQFEMHDNLTSVDGNDMRIKADGAGTLEVGKWLMWTFIWNADRTVDWYENGQKKGDSPATADTTDGKKMEVKYFGAGYGTSSQPFEGAMTEISHYTDVLTQAEINDLYNDGKTKSALDASGSGGLSLYLRNNGLAEWKDLKGSNDANVDSAETMLITAGADATRDSQGFLMNRQRVINSLNLDYNQSYNLIRKGLDTDNITADGGSFSAWIYPTDMGGGDYGRIFEKGGIHYCYIQAFSSDTCKLVYATKFSSSGICNFTTDNRDITLNEWNYISVTYDGSATGNAALIYVNGVLVDSSEDETRSGTIVDDSGHDMYVGNRADFIRHFDGQIDDLNFYSDILTAAEVKEIITQVKGVTDNGTL